MPVVHSQLPQPQELSLLTALGCPGAIPLMWITPPLGWAAGQINVTFRATSALLLQLLYKARAEHHQTPHFLSFHSCRCPYLTSGTWTFPSSFSGVWVTGCTHWGMHKGSSRCTVCDNVTTPHEQRPPYTHCCSSAWNDYEQTICLLCFWQPYSSNAVATTHDPPLVFPKPQAAPKGCPLSDAHQRRKPTCNHEARTPLNGWNGWSGRYFPT